MASFLLFDASGPLGSIARRYVWSVPIVAVLGFVASALEGVGIGLLIPLLTTLLNADHPSGRAGFAWLDRWIGGTAPGTRLAIIAGAIFILVLLKNVVATTGQVFSSWIDGRAGHDVRCALARQLLWVGYPFHLAQDPARLVNIVGTESWRASDAIRAMFSMISAAASITIFAVLLVIVSWKLTAAVLLGTVLIRLAHSKQVRRLKHMSVAVSESNSKLAERMLVTVLAMRLTRVFGQEAGEQKKFDDASEKVRRTMFTMESSSAQIPPTQEVLQTALFIAILLGGTLSGAGVPVPVLVTFLVLLQRMQPHLRTFEGARAAVVSAEGPVREVEWLLSIADKPAPPTGTGPYQRLERSISFHAVGFHYHTRPGAAAALEGVTFDIPAGRATALIGSSGSGKSTIVNLLCRLLEPTSGQILIDGRNLAEIDPAAWRSRISLAGQDIEFVDGTIAENIAYGAPGLPLAEIEAAARAADADSFIRRLPQGYASSVGSGGLSLSGGQRQRIGLARAIARRPDLLILDEATNAIDGLSEASIMSLLHDRPGDMTLLVVSHRASTLALCDYGVVVAGGAVAEAGPLGSLTAYRQMALSSPE